MEMKKYKITAFAGMILMGISCVMACLSESVLWMNVGNVLLLASVAVMSYAFYYWRP